MDSELSSTNIQVRITSKNMQKFNSVTGTKGYRWLESEIVKSLNKEDDIDMSYYENMAEEAKNTIEQFGSFEDFVKE